MWQSIHQMWEKNKWTTECDKSTVTCDVSTTQYEDKTVKCKRKKKREPPNVTKLLSNVMLVILDVTMKPSNVRKK